MIPSGASGSNISILALNDFSEAVVLNREVCSRTLESTQSYLTTRVGGASCSAAQTTRSTKRRMSSTSNSVTANAGGFWRTFGTGRISIRKVDNLTRHYNADKLRHPQGRTIREGRRHWLPQLLALKSVREERGERKEQTNEGTTPLLFIALGGEWKAKHRTNFKS